MASGVNQNGATSKQALVRDEILGMLVDELQVGDALPSERRLARELGVSRPTLRAVIDELVREGLLLRRHGSGTYVAEPKIALPLTMTSFSEDMARRGMRPSSQRRRPSSARAPGPSSASACRSRRWTRSG